MSLSKFYQTPEMLKKLEEVGIDAYKPYMVEKGLEWYDNNPEEGQLIIDNLTTLGISPTEKLVSEIKEKIILHYHEKMIAFVGSATDYARFLKEHVDYDEAIETLTRMKKEKGAVLLTSPHFGAIEFLIPTLSMAMFDISMVLKYSTPEFSQKSRAMAQEMTDTGLFGKLEFIELGKPNTTAALEMASALRKDKILFSVFDEETPYSAESTLMGKKVWGGAGLDRLLKFTRKDVAIGTIFMLRTGEQKYKMKLVEINNDETAIQQMYDNLESVLKENLTDWYFLHEEIPFVKK